MGTYDAHLNFAYSTVATAPSPATSGTSLVVQAGDGAKFPSVSFNATIWPTAAQPTAANSEIVRVTGISTDTFTITRAQESSSARSVIVGDQIAATITAKVLTDIESRAPQFSQITGTSQTIVNNTNYIANNVGLVTFTLPTTASIGDLFTVAGIGTGGWRIAQNASQIIHFGDLDTTTGVTGRLDSTQRRDSVTCVCTVTNNEWDVIASVGNITVT